MGRRTRQRPRAPPVAPLLRRGAPVRHRSLPGSLAERLQFRGDAFLINIILGVRQTGIYSVTSGLAETLWYIPNAMGTVMFSRAVDPKLDAGRIAAMLTRTTLAVALVTAIPALIFGPRLVRFIYGAQFADAGVALRLILPGIVAYSVVAVLSRYITGQGRPGTGTLILVAGLAINIGANLALIPAFGIRGAAAASSLSYIVTAALTLIVFHRLSDRGMRETLIIRTSDIRALMAASRASSTGPAAGGGDRSSGSAAAIRRQTSSSARANQARNPSRGYPTGRHRRQPASVLGWRDPPRERHLRTVRRGTLDLPGSPVESITTVVPVRDADAPPARLPLDPRIRVVRSAPFEGSPATCVICPRCCGPTGRRCRV